LDLKMDEPTAPTDPPHVTPAWSLPRRLLFRFTFVYFVLYLFPFPLDIIPYVGVIGQWYQSLWNAIVPWVGKHLFHVDITVRPNGSGDTTYNYVQVLCYLVLALVAAALWSLLDRERPHYARLHGWLRVYIRFGLASVMISYGAVKVIKSQFPNPTLDRLLQPFGDASPMGLLWTFIGASMAYSVFSGACEMLGGLLLVSRRTTILGALFSIAVLGNVVMLNFCYDVPVKLYSLSSSPPPTSGGSPPCSCGTAGWSPLRSTPSSHGPGCVAAGWSSARCSSSSPPGCRSMAPTRAAGPMATSPPSRRSTASGTSRRSRSTARCGRP
jgi:hypothetical protein